MRGRIEPGFRFTWGTLSDIGEGGLRPAVLRHLAGLESGAPADPTDLEAARARLEASGWVRVRSDLAMRRRARSGRIDVDADLERTASSSLDLSAGWTQGDGWTGSGLAHLSNLLGTGRDLAFGISRGDDGTSAEASWKEPWIAGSPLSGSASGSFRDDTLGRDLSIAGELSWRPFRSPLELAWGAGAAWRTELDPDDSATVRRERETSSHVSATRVWGSPSDLWPRAFRSLSGTLEASRTGSGTRRLRARAAAEQILSLGGSWGLRLAARGRGVWPLDTTILLSESEPPGGITGWRGWRDGTPRSPSWAFATVEVRLGDGAPAGLSAFVEPGLWWNRLADSRDYGPRAGATGGFGLLLRPPSWDLLLCLAAPLDETDWNSALLQLRLRNNF